jgi:putative ABC transport system ATP-binding protein
MNDAVAVSLVNVSRRFQTDAGTVTALEGINLDIQRGEYLAIIGASGSGKSTLLAILGLLDTISAGEHWFEGVRVHGASVAERAARRGQGIGFVFQTFNLISDLTVQANVELALKYQGVTKSVRASLAEVALGRVGMLGRRSAYPNELSGGQQQRVAIARAVAGSPSLVLADEPTGSLDSENGAIIMELLRDLNAAGTTICLVTHEACYAAQAGRIIRLVDGKVVE